MFDVLYRLDNFRKFNMATSECAGMERWKGKVALVTGASVGIGYDLAKQLAQLGMNVVGCARNTATIEVQP